MILENAICLSTLILDCDQIAWVEIETQNSIFVYLSNGELIKLVEADAALLIKKIRYRNILDLSSQFKSFLDYLPEKEQDEKILPF